MKLEFESNVAATPSFTGNYVADADSAVEKDVSRMLQAGVKAAQAGNRADARHLLLQVTEAAPDNENAWLWLASISDYPEELLVFLNNVLNINPHNVRALEWAAATKSLLAKNFVQRGVDASNEAQMDFAKQCFLQAVVNDERNEMAWFWLASISDSVEEKISHLQKVLNINPQNETALTALQTAKSQISESLLRKANTAAIAGEREAAGEMLQKVLKQTPESEEAWILKSYLADSFSDKVVCFEKVLSINPENDAAISGLASLREMMTRTENRKTQNLAVVAAFLSENSAENRMREESIEDSNVSEAVFAEDRTAQEAEFSPAIIETENNSYSYQEEVSAGYQEPEATETIDFQAAQPFTETENYQAADSEEVSEDNAEMFTEMQNAAEFEAAPQHYAGYPDEDVYSTPTGDLKFNSENASETVHSSNAEVEEPIQQNLSAVKKIMVIDDSATVRKLIAQKLEANGYEVICSADGIEALETIKAVVPDLILLDTAMPQMDGYQVCQSIRSNEATKDVPVVMISGKDGFFDKVRGQMSGSTGYIAKPFGPETLMKTVESYMV